MADFNKVLTPGDYQNGFVNTVVEIPQGSILKIEWDREHAAFMIDRVEPRIYAKPVNYGFIPQTIDEDGDELDTLVITDEPIPTGVWLETRIIGILNFEDDGEMVPFDYHLKHGDHIEVITKKNAKPKTDWLEHVITTHAKNKIKAHIKKLN